MSILIFKHPESEALKAVNKALNAENQRLRDQLEILKPFCRERPKDETRIRRAEGYWTETFDYCDKCGKYIVDHEDLNYCQNCGRPYTKT